MLFLKLTLYTCAFYIAIALPIILLELAAEFRGGGIFGISFHGRSAILAFIGFWGMIWLAAFLLAVHSAIPILWTRLVR